MTYHSSELLDSWETSLVICRCVRFFEQYVSHGKTDTACSLMHRHQSACTVVCSTLL